MQPQQRSIQNEFVTTSKKIVKSFLQSVVVVDDKATFGEQIEPVEEVQTPISRGGRDSKLATNEKTVKSQADINKLSSVDAKNSDPELLNVKRLSDCFTDIGLVCSIIRPTEAETALLYTKTDHVARRADIVVFDWILNKNESPGSTALKSILSILREDQQQISISIPQSRTRLIAVYTSEPDLNKVVETTRKFLKKSELEFTLEDKFTLTKSGAKIVFYKKDRGIGVSPEIQARTVNEIQLPDRLVDDFTIMTQGLLSNVALASLGALRDNTYRILDKFNQSQDAPYVSHRAMSMPTEDTQGHPIPLLTAEFNDVLEDCGIDQYTSINMIRDWINYQVDNQFMSFEGKVSTMSPEAIKEALLDLVENGFDLAYSKSSEVGQPSAWKGFLKKIEKKDVNSLVTGLLTKSGTPSESDLSFAALTILRSRYKRPIPKLTLGTIVEVHESKEKNYYICIQPICDSVRLNQNTPFLFLKLTEIDSNNEKKFNLVIQENQKYKKFQIELKSRDSKLYTMAQHHSGEIIAEEKKGLFYFNVKGKSLKMRWLADLKFAHAQRIANDFAREISRVGLTESEWLRRMGR